MVETTLLYLAHDKLYDVEKPFSAEFTIEEAEGVQKTNYILSEVPVTIQAISPSATGVHSSNRFRLDVNGFCVFEDTTHLDVKAALERSGAAEAEYLEELKVILRKRFPEYTRVEALEFVVRKRDDRFPKDEDAVITHEQPARITHSDFSVNGAMLQLRDTFPDQEKYFEDKEYDMIKSEHAFIYLINTELRYALLCTADASRDSVWRPLVGPNDDWPLAVCDYTSIDPKNDIISADRLHKDRIGENQLLFPSEKHRWYYVEGQQTCDLLVFRNIDSTGRRARSFHAAFFNPHSRGVPRQSCEARFVAFR